MIRNIQNMEKLIKLQVFAIGQKLIDINYWDY